MPKRNLNTNRLANGGKNTTNSRKDSFATNLNDEQNGLFATPVLGLGVEDRTRFNNSMNYGPLLEFDEVCKLLRISRSTLYLLVNKKEIKAIKLRGKTLFRVNDVYNYISTLPEYEGAQNVL